MDARIRILMLEDSSQDAELAERTLRRAGLDVAIKRVVTEEAFRAEVTSAQYEVILADLHLRELDGMSALAIARAQVPETPFIFVSASIDEEQAIAALRDGACDYILKDRPSRLPAAVTSALAQRRERESRAHLQAALIESEASRVNNLGRIAATLAHEFNNVLMGIQPFADVIRRRSGDENVQAAATQILGSVARGRRLTQEILRTTQLGEAELAPVDIGALIGSLREELAAVVAPKVALRVHLPEGRLVAICDAAQVQQVVTSLATNARDAMPSGGELLVSVESIPCADKLMAGITVSDTGTGIPAGILPSIFDPLFTTKRTGTGLGLAVVQQLVSRNHGSISVASQEGKGTTFAILLEAAM